MQDKKIIAYTQEGIKLEYVETEKGLQQFAFNTIETEKAAGNLASAPNFQLAVAGWAHGFSPDTVTGFTNFF